MKIEFLDPLFELLERCKTVKQDKKWHPEGNVYNHSIQCFNFAMADTQDVDLILAALFHDLGKLIEDHGHEQHSVSMCEKFLSNKSLWLIKNHMKINYLLAGTMKKLGKIKALKENQWYNDLLLLNKFDKAARNIDYSFKDRLFDKFFAILKDYNPTTFMCAWCNLKHFMGADFGEPYSHGLCERAEKKVLMKEQEARHQKNLIISKGDNS